MKMYKLIVLAFFIFTVIGNSFAQDIHFTQASETPMLINPAATGVFNGWERFSINHKNQWVNTGTKFYTTSIAADVNLFKSKRGDGAHMGMGLQFYNDIGGDSKFGTRQVLLSFSGVVPLSKNQQFSGGLQFGFGQKFGDFTSLNFANQFDGTEFNSQVPNFEANNLSSQVYGDVSAGVFYRYSNQKLSFARGNLLDFRFGVAYFHVNRPSLSYNLGSEEKLFGKIVIHSSIVKDFDGSKIGIKVYVNVYNQGPHNETLVAALIRYRIKSGGRITGMSRDVYLAFGLAVRYKASIAPTVNFQYKNFNFGMSYDVNTADFGQYYKSGGLEFSLKYTNMDFALFKRRH